MRYRLIPTRKRHFYGIRHVEAAHEVQAINYAEGASEEWKVPVLLCSAPLDGLVREVGVFGEDPEAKKRGH